MTLLNERIRRWRESRGLTKAELARRCGVSPEAVGQWEDDREDKRTTPTTANVAKIAGAVGIDVSVFWGVLPEQAS